MNDKVNQAGWTISGNTPQGFVTDLLKQLPLITVILIMLYLCGGLALIFYWELLNVNIVSMIGAGDIPKYCIYPLIFVHAYNGFCGLIFLGRYWIARWINKQLKEEYFERNCFQIAFAIIFAIAGIVILFFYGFNWGFWFCCTCILIIILSTAIRKLPFLSNGIKFAMVRGYVVSLFIGTPSFAIIMSWHNACKIQHNIDVHLVKIAFKDTVAAGIPGHVGALKLLGFPGDKCIISSLDNKNIYILNQSSIHHIELSEQQDAP